MAKQRGGDAKRGAFLLVPAEIVASPETGLRYRVERLLGEGGFGQVDLARRIGRSSVVPETVCITVSNWIDGCLREIAGILEVLGKLHRGQTLHRDLTPVNVFVCDRRRLKLCGGQGRRHQADGSQTPARERPAHHAAQRAAVLAAREAMRHGLAADAGKIGRRDVVEADNT